MVYGQSAKWGDGKRLKVFVLCLSLLNRMIVDLRSTNFWLSHSSQAHWSFNNLSAQSFPHLQLRLDSSCTAVSNDFIGMLHCLQPPASVLALCKCKQLHSELSQSKFKRREPSVQCALCCIQLETPKMEARRNLVLSRVWVQLSELSCACLSSPWLVEHTQLPKTKQSAASEHTPKRKLQKTTTLPVHWLHYPEYQRQRRTLGTPTRRSRRLPGLPGGA